MAWTPPTRHLKKKGLTNDKEFYRKLSGKCNFADEEAVLFWYTGLVRLVGQELRHNKFVRLPHLGDFAVVTQKSRPAWAGKMHVRLGPTEVLKFYPKERLRKYVRKEISSRTGA